MPLSDFEPATLLPPAPPAPNPTALMWPRQAEFQHAAQFNAQTIFDELDESLQPEVYLLGVLMDEAAAPGRLLVCVEPPELALTDELVVAIGARDAGLQRLREADTLLTVLPDPDAMTTPTVLETEVDRERRFSTGLRAALQELLAIHHDQHDDVISFCSRPVPVTGGYRVSTVLQLQGRAYRSHPTIIPPDESAGDSVDRLAVSLLDAAVFRFLVEHRKRLLAPDPGLGMLARHHDPDELLRAAGRYFMDTPARLINPEKALLRLFSTCNTLSSLRYEGNDSRGGMLLSRRGHPNVEMLLVLTRPVALSDFPAVRKLLEMSNEDISLLCDTDVIYGLGRPTGVYEPIRHDLFTVAFTQHFHWDLLHGGRVLMHVAYGQPTLPKPRVNRLNFRRALEKVFKLRDGAQAERLWEVVQEAARQKRGTMVVISTEARAEAERLRTQSTLLEPVLPTPLLTRLVTAIDGALLLDVEGFCHAVGVILDGKSRPDRGTSTRGARFNSAVRYVESSPYPSLAVVVSEDGLVDIVTRRKEE